jgi:hypothetical protein
MTITVMVVMTATGCKNNAAWNQFVSDTKRKLKPRFLRTQIFSNMPTAYNQQADPETMDPRSKKFVRRGEVRLKENLHLAGKVKEDPYGRGFQDGCANMVSILGGGPYRLIKLQIHPNRLTNDPWYLRGYQDGTTLCTHRIDWEIH